MATDVKHLPKDGGDDKSQPEAAVAAKVVQEFTPKDNQEQSQAAQKTRSDSSTAAVLPAVTIEEGKDKPRSTDKPIDRAALEKDAEALRQATGNDNYIARWADKEKIIELLKSRSAEERKVIDEIYKKKYGVNLEQEMSFMTGSDKTRFLGALKRKDGNQESLAADRISTALTERGEWTGRSNSIIEKDLRDSLRTASSAQVAVIAREFEEKTGKPLKQAIEENKHLNPETREALLTYMKGNDKREPGDFQKLSDLALKSGDLQFFKEVMKDGSPAERLQFLNADGDRRMRSQWSGSDLSHARDFAQAGKLSVETQVKENTGVLMDNTKGIELALSRMTESERSDYRIGRHLKETVRGQESVLSGADQERLNKMSLPERNSVMEKHTSLRSSLEAAGNDTELARWESQINRRGGSIASELDKHRGTFWNDSAQEIGTSLENMSKKQWEEAKADPQGTRRELELMLESLNKTGEEKEKLLKVFDTKMKADSFEATADSGKLSVLDRMDEKWHFYRNDQGGMLESIAAMSAEDRQRYQKDREFKEELDRKVARYMSGDTREEAERLLKQVESNQKPEASIVTKLTAHAANFNTDENKAIRDIRDAFNQDPKLLERLVNPQSETDRKFAQAFEKAGRAALGHDMYDDFVGELLKKGAISSEKMTELSKGYFSDDEESTYEDIARSSKENRDRLLNDAAYQKEVLSHLNEDERKIALAAASQGEYRPEDKIRALCLGYGGGKDLVEILKGVPEDKLARMKADYATKYGTSFEADLMDKLGGQDLAEARRILAKDKSVVEQVDLAKDEAYSTRSGFGAGFADVVSSTGKQADDVFDTMLQTAADANRAGKTTSPQEMKLMLEDFAKAIDNHRETKSAAADYTADAVIAGGAIASVIATGGTNLPLLAAALAAGGAATKVGTKSALMGSDYDFRLSTVAKDATIGALTGATSVFGQAQLAAVFKVGQQAATSAATATITNLSKESLEEIAKKAGVELVEGAVKPHGFLTAGYEKILTEGTESTMRNLLANGARKIEEKAFAPLAEKLVDAGIEGPLRQAAVAAVQKELTEQATREFTKHTANWLVYQATSQGLNAGAGGGANSLTGTMEGAMSWDSRKSVGENLANVGKHTVNSTLAGAGGALVFGAVAKTAESGITAFKGKAVQLDGNIKSEEVPGVAATGETAGTVRESRTAGTGRDSHWRRPEGSGVQEDFSPAMASIEKPRSPSAGAGEEKLWVPVRDWEKLGAAERRALFAVLGDNRSPLAYGEATNKFIDTLESVTGKWHQDFSEIPALVGKERARFDQTGQKMNELLDRYGFPRRGGELDTEAFAKLVKDHPQDKLAFENYLEARKAYSEATALQNRALRERVDDVQWVMDEFTQANGLPKVTVKAGQGHYMSGAAASYRPGEITLHPDQLLGKGNSLDLIEAGYHELTHHEQNFTIVRKIADELKIGNNAGEGEVAQLRKLFKERTNQVMPENVAQEMLAARGKLEPMPLTAAEKVRAGALEQAIAKNAPAGEKLVELGNDFRTIKSLLKPFQLGKDPNAAFKLLQRLNENGSEALNQRLFGTPTPPNAVQVFADRVEAHLKYGTDSWTKQEATAATKLLQETMEKRLKEINLSRQEVYQDYMRTHEVDAFVSGQRARASGIDRGYKPVEPPKPVRSDEEADGLILENLGSGSREQANLHLESLGKDVTGGKISKPRLSFEGGSGQAGSYDLASDTVTFDHASLTVKYPANKLKTELRRPEGFREGEVLTIRGLTEDMPGPVRVKVVTANSERVSLKYEGPLTTSRQALGKYDQGQAEQLEEFIVASIEPRLKDPNFSGAASADYFVTKALMKGDNLSSADTSALNYALKNVADEPQFRQALFQELAARGKEGTLPEKTAQLWFNEIGERLKANPKERTQAYQDFLESTPTEIKNRVTARPEAQEALRKAGLLEMPESAAPVENRHWSQEELPQTVRQLEDTKADIIRKPEFRQTHSMGERSQLAVWNFLTSEKDGILPRLKQQNKISQDWQIYPSEAGSPLDRAGADFILVNKKTGDVHFLDATANADKKNVFKIREEGVIHIDHEIFDVSGALKVDDLDVNIASRARDFKPELEQQILSLVESPAALKLGADGPPLPSLTRASDADATRQLNALIDWAEQKSKLADMEADKALFHDMAATLGRARNYSNMKATEHASTTLKEQLDSAARGELLRYAVARIKNGSYSKNVQTNPAADVQLHKDGRIVLKTTEGAYYHGGALAESVEGARRLFLDRSALARSLSNKQIEDLGGNAKALKTLSGAERQAAIEKEMKQNATFRRNVEQASQVMISDRSIISTGLAQGSGAAVLNDNIIGRLRSRKDGDLLQPTAPLKPKAPETTVSEPLDKTMPKAAQILREWREPPGTPEQASANIAEILDLVAGESKALPAAEHARLVKLRDAYKDPNHPDHARAVKQVHDLMLAD
ncbi:MAG: hypothetical protein SFV17_10670 [Candidatus Obscuribacter sp.]|nr:hypothetical protein [Candidatus Obscuribacter sp.]